MNPSFPTVIIENLSPLIEGGRYPVKRVVGQSLRIEADIFKDGHDVLVAVLKWRKCGQRNWFETPMRALINDRWEATCSFEENAPYECSIEAWGDPFLSWQAEFEKKYTAGIQDLGSETLEGAALVEGAATRATQGADRERLNELALQLRSAETDRDVAADLVRAKELTVLMALYADRALATEFRPYLKVTVDRAKALFAAWYEFFPRSAEGKPDSGSTFRDCLTRVDDAKAMGFDVIYFPPIHPIGVSKRKGRNNSVTSEPGEPGVPYAIGSAEGGHKAVAPELGTLKDFAWLVKEIKKRGMEVALDFAINCSPDHPYVSAHPEWFFKRPDGTIKYAENPPKKYEDIYPLNFHNPDWKSLWEEMKSIILFWAKQEVRIFRVDNPHTKPVAFWEWMIREVQKQYPDVIFLSEAFTRPKMMQSLAKSGFTQSYTYFTWRNTRAELVEYFTELTQTDMKEYFRANLWPNTPDILPHFLQQGGRPAFLIRALLATTLSTVYGIYSGFELCENAAIPGKEEYLDSEKYQFKGRDWNAEGNIKEFITVLNRIRRENRALQSYENLVFCDGTNDQILAYAKTTAALDNLLLIVLTLDPWQAQSGKISVPLETFGFAEGETYQMHDLLDGNRYLWKGRENFVSLNPNGRIAHVFRIRRWVRREGNTDFFV